MSENNWSTDETCIVNCNSLIVISVPMFKIKCITEK